MESPKRPSKLIFVVLNFMTVTSPGAWHCCTNDDVIDTSAHNLLCYYAIYTYRDLLAILESIGHTATMFVAMVHAHHHGLTLYHITVDINVRGWENFVTAKSTTKITKISTPRKLPAIRYYVYPNMSKLKIHYYNYRHSIDLC